jgi:hypothetical protein
LQGRPSPRVGDRDGLASTLPLVTNAIDSKEMLGAHPQPFRYYLGLMLGTFRTALDVGMLVVGTGLVGLAAAVLADGFGLLEIGFELSTGAMLGTALVIAVLGAFALGIASEGGYGSTRATAPYPSLEVAIGRLVFMVGVAVLLLTAASQLEPLVLDLNVAFGVAQEVIRACGAAGLFTALVGVPVTWGLRMGLARLDWGFSLDVPVLYVIWLVAALVSFDAPL